MNLLPVARNTKLVVQNLNGEVLIYDLVTDQVLCLNDTSAKVFNHCDGITSFEDLKRKYQFTDDLIYLAIDTLRDKNLLTGEISSHFAGISRREVIRKVGFASMVALPVIASLVAPTAANAQSGGCNSPADCPESANQCVRAACAGRVCGFSPAPVGTACNQSGGTICNGAGNCVQCLSKNDCPGQDTECQTRTCNSGVCGFNFAPIGARCGIGDICNGTGTCI